MKKPRQSIASPGRGPAMICALLLAGSIMSAQPARESAPKELDDPEISSAVQSDLLFDSSVPANEIDVTTSKGVVTLSGMVPNLLAKERAALIAGSIRGVRAVINDMMVKPSARTDKEIRVDLEAALRADPATDSYEVTPSVRDGVVTLSGTVDSWQEKELAATVAKGVRGVMKVDNKIAVDYKSERPDGEIAAEIERNMARDVWVDGSLINVEVKDGEVKLTGTVSSVAEKGRAYAAAWTAGVKWVDDSALEVDPQAGDSDMRRVGKIAIRTDEEIRKAIEDALLYDPRVFSFNPTVSVRNSVVTLSGTVDNLKAKRAAEQDARNTVGVWRVKNHLKVRGEEPPTDAELVRNVLDALDRDPYVSRFDISVNAIGGTVYLTGGVDSPFERSQAEEVASRVNGVTSINNNLVVDYPSLTYYSWPYSWHYNAPYYYNRIPIWSGSTDKADAEIKDDIEGEFFRSPFVDGRNIEISVNGGTATLTGTVDSWRALNSATENAYEGGALKVINRLAIKNNQPTNP